MEISIEKEYLISLWTRCGDSKEKAYSLCKDLERFIYKLSSEHSIYIETQSKLIGNIFDAYNEYEIILETPVSGDEVKYITIDGKKYKAIEITNL